MTDKQSFINIINLNDQIDLYGKEDIHRVVVGCKADLKHKIQVTDQDINALCKAMEEKGSDISFSIQTSAKTGKNINLTIESVAFILLAPYKTYTMPFFG